MKCELKKQCKKETYEVAPAYYVHFRKILDLNNRIVLYSFIIFQETILYRLPTTHLIGFAYSSRGKFATEDGIYTIQTEGGAKGSD